MSPAMLSKLDSCYRLVSSFIHNLFVVFFFTFVRIAHRITMVLIQVQCSLNAA